MSAEDGRITLALSRDETETIVGASGWLAQWCEDDPAEVGRHDAQQHDAGPTTTTVRLQAIVERLNEAMGLGGR